MSITKNTIKKIGLLVILGGLGWILGWLSQQQNAFFYPPPGIMP